MDSFFSLFDPSEGGSKPSKAKHKPADAPDHVKKTQAADPPKVGGRRRGRRAGGRGSPLPEESSFLCQPQQAGGVMLGGSYIDHHLELNATDARADTEKRPRRRNSVRKSRRKRAKTSPPVDLLPWPVDEDGNPMDDGGRVEDVALNNRSACVKPKNSREDVGKNVNDLRGRTPRAPHTPRRTEPFALSEVYCGNSSSDEVHSLIEKLEKVSFKDDAYTCGDFNPADLGEDVPYSDDGDDTDSYGDSTSELEDTSDETYGSLPPEPRYGGVEYKLQLVSPCERRFQHLVTQLKWRLRSGGGSAIYLVGVRDCGALRGLRARALRASLRTLRRMARALSAHLAHVTARRVAPHRAVAEVYIRKLAETQQSVELRVAVMGANEAGKSTLIGVLTQGELDNGRGSARLNMFRHVHEVRSGRTSSLSHEILGFDAQGNVVNYGCSELMTAERIGERSAKLVAFLDLAGHSKYQRTTVSGLTGYSPHYAMLVVSATAGITHITEEHIGLLLALELPFFTVISKCELEPYGALLQELAAILERSNKKPLLITDEHSARHCVAPRRLILDSVDSGLETVDQPSPHDQSEAEQIPVFPVSCVRGIGLNALHAYLLALAPPVLDIQHKPEEESCEFQIDEVFHVGDSAGAVVGGLLSRGRLYEGDHLLLGPLDSGEFVKISVSTIYRNRVPCDSVCAGHSASLGLSPHPAAVRAGMVLLAIPERYGAGASRPVFAACAGQCEGRRNDPAPATTNKIERRKDKNLLKDIQLAAARLQKTPSGSESNIYRGEAGEKGARPERGESQEKGGGAERGVQEGGKECACAGEVYLDNPDDPRGCLYFQATVHLLRHSTGHIGPGFQCTVHIGNVRQTAIIEGILSPAGVLTVGGRASVVFRFARWPEYVRPRRRLLLRAGRDTVAVGRLAQVFPFVNAGVD